MLRLIGRFCLLLLPPLIALALLLPVLGGLAGGHAVAYINLYTLAREIVRHDIQRDFLMHAATLTGHIPAAEAWSPDRQRLAYVVVRRNTEIHVLDFETGTDTNVSGEDLFSHDPVWSHDGRWLAYYSLAGSGGETLRVWSAEDNVPRLVGPGQPVSGAQWSPVADTLAYIMTAQTNSSQLSVWDASTGETLFVDQHSAHDARPVWSPDGAHLVFESNRDGEWAVYLIRSDGSGLRRISDRPGREYRAVWSPDGRYVAFVGLYRGVWSMQLWDAAADTVRTVFETTAADLFPLWSPNGHWLTLYMIPEYGQESHVLVWDMVAETMRTVPGDAVRYPVWSPDSERLAFIGLVGDDEDLFVLHLPTWQAVNISQATGRDSDPEWSPDGALLAYRSDRSGTPDLYLWDGTLTRRLTDDEAANANLVWLW